MSIASQLTAYENGLTDSYNMVSQMGGTMPVHKNMSSLASSIATIPSGGGGFTFAVPLKDDGNGNISAGSSTPFTITSPAEITTLPTDANRGKQFAYMFYGCTGLTKADFSSITGPVTSGNIQYLFARCSDLEEVNLSGITAIGTTTGSSMAFWFDHCSKLTKVDLSGVESIGNLGLNNAFNACTSLQSVTFDSLEYVFSTNPLRGTFNGCTSLTTVSFPSFNQSSHTSTTTTGPMQNMLSGCSNVTVHFPSSQQATVSAWTTTTNGFGGTNTTVLYDL